MEFFGQSGNGGTPSPVQQRPPRPSMGMAARLRLWTIFGLVAIGYVVVQFGVGFYTDWLWFQHLNLQSVYMTGFVARFWVGLLIGLPFLALFLGNTFFARWQSVRNVLFFTDEFLVAQKFVAWLIVGLGLFLAWLFASAASANWLLFLRYFNRQPFNLTDPVFNQDVGFYLFTLPVLKFGQSWLMITLILAALGAVAIYVLAQQNNLVEGRIVVLPHVQLHLSVMGALVMFTIALGHWVDLFDLMYSPRGVAFGASYTDIHVTMPATWVMIGVAVVAGVILLANIFLRRPALSLLAIFIWIIVGVIGTGVIPAFVQRWVVEPNELAAEAPFITNNITLTSVAYGLDKIKELDFPPIEPLTPQKVAEHGTFLKNVRLWDYRPLQQTYQQIQAIRLYYHFYDVDFDRYMVDGELRQVALSARELDKTQLQSPTWVTQKMQFTHGYGVVVNPVNEITKEGLPQLWVKDLPPVSTVDNLAINRPEIYYGEGVNDYVFVNTTEREFDYPSGDQNVFSTYGGTGGVVLDSVVKRLAFALDLADLNMLLSNEFTSQSRVMLYRNISQRVTKIAPFLQYDHDPYLVINPEDGRLYWIQDAYTTSDLFPYAEPIGGINYIRNSVKVVIDAYNGSLDFYVTDPVDPLVQAYMGIFPGLFTSMEAMPAWVRAQIRYPEDIFRIQSSLYLTYHMRDVNVFYNKEDLWQTPNETFAGNTQPVEPYYVILAMPGEEKSEFALIQPFTPNNKDNLIAWLAARSDGENYGQLVVYRFPKQELVFGPLQIEARIDQNTEISAQITLWDQGGSEVIRGNLLVLPIANSLLYVEPLYLRAENGQIPELKRVIVASGDTIVMRETLGDALLALFEEQGNSAPPAEAQPAPTPESTTTSPTDTLPVEQTLGEVARNASVHYEAAQQALRRGDWAEYGREMSQVEAALKTIMELTGQTLP
jgi:hypothetical protein